MILTAIALGAALVSTSGAAASLDPVAAGSFGADAPRAEIRVFARDTGRGIRGGAFNGSSATLCVASTTGRYRLRVLSTSGGAMRGNDVRAALAYRVRFRDASGTEQVKQMTSGDLTFEGRSPGKADCSAGANALVLIDSAEAAIQASIAGEFTDRLTLSVEPL